MGETATAAPVQYLGVGDIAERLGVPRHRVEFILAAYSIPIAVMIGKSRGYEDASVGVVRYHLERINLHQRTA